MTESINTAGQQIRNHGWRTTFAGMGINLALGVLYSWSIISSAIDKAGWGWTAAERSLPYSVACLVFCLMMVPAGRMQDKLSPRLTASIGGLLVGLGMILTSFNTSVMSYVIGFGVLAGSGIGFGYASATPPAVKWFPAAKTGLITGLVVSGFGLASVYIAPLGNWLINSFGISTMICVFGIGFLIIVVALAQILIPPPKGYVVPVKVDAGKPAVSTVVNKNEYSSMEMLKTWQFYLLWFMYACGAGAGLMVISVAKGIAGKGAIGVYAVMALAIGNGAGRIIAGILSDKLGRKQTLFLFFLLQAIAVFLLSVASTQTIALAKSNVLSASSSTVASTAVSKSAVAPVASSSTVASTSTGVMSAGILMILLAAFVGANYGSNLALFPSITKDFYGLKNFGMNYGFVFTAWGVGGFLLSLLAGMVYDQTKNFTFAFYCSIVLLIIAGTMVFLVKPPKDKTV